MIINVKMAMNNFCRLDNKFKSIFIIFDINIETAIYQNMERYETTCFSFSIFFIFRVFIHLSVGDIDVCCVFYVLNDKKFISIFT